MLFHTNFRYYSHALSHLRFPLCTSNWKWLCDKLQMSSGFWFFTTTVCQILQILLKIQMSLHFHWPSCCKCCKLSVTISYNWKPFKNYEKYFLFYVESSIRARDIYAFVLTASQGHVRKWLHQKAKVNFKIYDVKG